MDLVESGQSERSVPGQLRVALQILREQRLFDLQLDGDRRNRAVVPARRVGRNAPAAEHEAGTETEQDFPAPRRPARRAHRSPRRRASRMA